MPCLLSTLPRCKLSYGDVQAPFVPCEWGGPQVTCKQKGIRESDVHSHTGVINAAQQSGEGQRDIPLVCSWHSQGIRIEPTQECNGVPAILGDLNCPKGQK